MNNFRSIIPLLLISIEFTACSLNPTKQPIAVSVDRTITPTATTARILLPTSTPGATLTHTPTPTTTPTNTPTITIIPTPTLLGGFSGEFLTVEGDTTRKEVVLWNAEGRKVKTLWRAPPDLKLGYIDVKWSSDGKVISIEYWKDGGYLVLLRPDGTEIKTTYTGITFYGGPNTQANWSPDGRWLVFVGKGDKNYVDVYRMDADGENLIQLTNTQQEENSPIFTPDGRSIIYRDKDDSLFIMEADGSNPKRLVWGPAAIIDWSPDGKSVILTKATPADFFIMDFETLELTRCTFDSSSNYEGGERFSPDGKWILFTAYGTTTGTRGYEGWEHLFILPVDGSQDPTLLAPVLTRNGEGARFTPDGAKIVFHGWPLGEDVEQDPPSFYSIQIDGSGLMKHSDRAFGFVVGIWKPDFNKMTRMEIIER